MSNPLNIYAANIDPAGVLEVLRRHGNVQVDGDDDNWTQATVTWKAGVFKKHKLVVGHSKEHYDGEDWQIQVRGMRGYFSQFGPSAAVDEALARLGGLKFTLAFPSNTFDLEKGDDKLPVVLAIAEHLDGILFTPGFLLDANFKVLVDPEGEAEEGAQWPASLPPAAFDDDYGEEDDDEEYDPPDAKRVVRRAMVLAAVGAAGLAQVEGGVDDVPAFHQQIREWLATTGLEEECETSELDLFRPDIEKADTDWFNALWRVEGLGVLAWALGLSKELPYDALVDVESLCDAVGFLRPADELNDIIQNASLRSPEDLSKEREHLLAFHWRMRDVQLRQAPMDFVAFSKDCWFGSFDLSRFRVVDGDMALRGVSVSAADGEVLRVHSSSAMERHHAINWLTGWHPVYSEVETHT